jgi:hypothetical protein
MKLGDNNLLLFTYTAAHLVPEPLGKERSDERQKVKDKRWCHSEGEAKPHCEKPPLINSNKNGRMDFP